MSLRKRIAPLLAGVLVLSGCAAPAAETLAPTSPEPTPEPTEEATELWGFPIDDTHDAFEVPTGGKLGTVLVTVEVGEEKFGFSVWAASDLEDPIQTMTAEGPERLRSYQLMDANFDGHMDFCYTYALAVANARYEVWVWDEAQEQFVGTGQLVGGLAVNEETQTISNYAKGGWAGALGTDTFYSWENNHLVCNRRVSTVPPEKGNDTVILVVENRTNGELVEVFRKEYPLSGGGAFQEAEKWRDLNYHGEEANTLWGFPIDDTHDAFEVPTGGKLGTVLVTVELVENEKAEFRRELQFAVWTAGDLEKPIQTMTAEWVSAFHWMDIRDANFDGYIDFGYMFAMGNHPAYYHYWIWDEKQGIFVSEPEFDQISVPEFDEETGIISGYSRDGDAGASGTYTFHQWKGGKLVCIRRIRTLAYGTRIRVTVEEPVDGVLTEILRLETDIETAFDEVEKWQDLNYHGE